MANFPLKQWLFMGAMCTGSVFFMTGCASDWDLNNIDMTMGLGSDGLGVKLGKTEKIKLEDILEIDANSSVQTDESNLYYLVEDGSTDIDVKVDNVDARFEKSVIETSQRVLSFDDALQQAGLPAGTTQLPIKTDFNPNGLAEGKSHVKFEVDVPEDIVSIRQVALQETPVILTMSLVKTPAVKFEIDKISDFSIQIPKFLRVKAGTLTPGWTIDENNVLHTASQEHLNNHICEFIVSVAEFGEDGVPENGIIKLSDSKTETSVNGTVHFRTPQAFTMHPNDYADVQFALQLSQGDRIFVNEATGVFNPVIDPEIDPIDIRSSLPDFLDDEDVRIKANNPTIKFDANLSNIPVGVNFSANLLAEKAGADGFTKTVNLPTMAMQEKKQTVAYYYQGETPYDPNGVVAGAQTQQVANISDLFEIIPDQVKVDMKEGRINVQNKEYTVALGNTYRAKADYNVYVPFEFNEGLTIVYNDSTDSMNDDLEDYAADGVIVKATASNVIPLELIASITAVDVNNQELKDVVFTQATIAPSKDGANAVETPVVLEATLKNPNDLKKIDRFFFHIKASGKESGKAHKLYSTQYLEMNDIKLYLKGQVIADFN